MLIHCTAGPGTDAGQYEGTIAWFQRERPGAESSAHVVIDRDGRRCTTVPWNLRAYHASARQGFYNRTRRSIELCKAIPIGVGTYPQAMYDSCAEQVLEWCRLDPFPLTREYIEAHSEVQADRSDPGPLWDWDRFMALLA